MKSSVTRRVVFTLSLLAALAGACLAPPRATRAQAPNEIAVIVNKSNPVDELSLSELREYFLAERGQWPKGGGKVRVVMLEPGLPARDAALRLIYNMNEKGYVSYFLGKKFRGETPDEPRRQASAADVIKFVSFVSGAIGYVRPEEVDASVKVLRVDGLSPGDPGYKLRF
jgi:phosphate transport system substrate-binding protein